MAQLVLNQQQAVVFGDAVRAAQGAGFDLRGRRAHGEVGDGRVFCFP